MTCPVCRTGQLVPGTATVTLTRGQVIVIVRGVPALICDNCGEEYADENISHSLLQLVDDAERAGVLVDIREYVAA